MYLKATVLSATLVFGIPAVADDDEDETPLGWAGTAGLGFLSTTGNSDTTNWNAQADVTKRTERWEHIFKAVAIGAETDGAKTAERYGLSAASRRDLSEKSYLFGRFTYDKDEFSSYPRQITETIGYGRRVLTGPTHLFNIEFGAGARQADFIDTTGATVDQDEFIVSANGHYTWQISEGAEFEQLLGIAAGSDNTRVDSVTSLRAPVLGPVGLKVSYTISHNTDVSPGFKSTDTFTAINLDYSFGPE